MMTKKSDNSENVDVIIPTARATQSQKDEVPQYSGMRSAKEFMTRLSLDNDDTDTTQSKSTKMIYFGTFDHISRMTDTLVVACYL
mmetsp:Transcript_54574/g.59222  ORF Transcript_54574/g.59222 Transcript_54574/m.59222 type:complete len:85 (+) Transcript_54574:64-318(+)